MKKVLTTFLVCLLAATLSAREAKVAVVMSKTSYDIAAEETGAAGKAWTAVANLADAAVRHFVEAGKGVVIDGPMGLYDQEEEFRVNRTTDEYLGMKYLYDVPMDGFRLRVGDNNHFIMGPYHADQALSNLLTESLPVLWQWA